MKIITIATIKLRGNHCNAISAGLLIPFSKTQTLINRTNYADDNAEKASKMTLGKSI